jgi:hypothetical protein
VALPQTDNFTGTDGTSPPNSNWTNMDVGTKIFTNTAVSVSDGSYGFSYWNADSFNNDQQSEVTFANALPKTGGPCVRMSGTNNCYMLDCNDSGGTNTFLYKRVSGSYSLLQNFGAVVFSVGDIAKISVTGTTIKCFKNGSQIGTDTTDSDLASGSAGVMAYVGGSNIVIDSCTVDNVGGGGGSRRRLLSQDPEPQGRRRGRRPLRSRRARVSPETGNQRVTG